MCEAEKAIAGFIYKACGNVRHLKLMVIHYIIQVVFYGKYLNISCVMEPVLSMVNFIHCQ